MKQLLIVCMVVLVMVCACTNKANDGLINEEVSNPIESSNIETSEPRNKVSEATLQALSRSNNQFALDLYAQLSQMEKDNSIFVSPISITTAMSLAYAGARNNTAAEIEKALHYKLEKQQLFSAFGHYQKKLRELSGIKVNIVNGIFAEQSYPWLGDYEKLIASNYPTEIVRVDYRNQAQKERQRINAWVYDETKERVKDLLNPDDIDGSTVNVLVNAIAFDGSWAVSFDKEETHDRTFMVSDEKEVSIPMMYAKGEYRYLNNELVHMAAIPYSDNSAELVLIVPTYDRTLADVEMVLGDEFASWHQALKLREKVAITLPKIKMTYRTDLKNVLQKLGIRDAWVKEKADFSGMLNMEKLYQLKEKDSYFSERLNFSKVIHKAYVTWDEEGTEAAAATAVVLSKSISRGPHVTCNQPFIFAIVEKDGTILFMGRVTDPSKL